MVLNATAKICISLMRETKYDSIDGFPAGCLNAFSGSFSFSQDSSSTSVGRSTSKLSLIRQFARDGMDHQYVLFLLDSTRPTE
jgi:hypothetical protein